VLCVWAMGWTVGVLGFDSRWGLGIFLFTTASRTALGPIQPPIQRVPGALSLGVKPLDLEADHSSPSSAELKNAWSYISTPQYAFMTWCSVKAQGRFTFTFTAFFPKCIFCRFAYPIGLFLFVSGTDALSLYIPVPY
jgi:hypothetical protein